MSEIFLSYKSERRLAAEHLSEVLKCYGYSVWFDYELIKGADFAEQIDQKLRTAKAVIVLWCTMAVKSRWVKEEVHLAYELGRLLPIKIEPCEPPFGFRLAETIDLSLWDGSPRSAILDPLIDALEQKIGRPAVQDRRALADYEAAWRRFGAPPLRAFALGQSIEPTEIVETEPPSNVISFPSLSHGEVTSQTAPPITTPFELSASSYQDPAARLVRSFIGRRRMQGFTGPGVPITAAAFSPDGSFALSGGEDGTVVLWNLVTGQKLRQLSRHRGPVRFVAYAPDMRTVISAGQDDSLNISRPENEETIHSLKWPGFSLTSAACSADGKFALMGGSDGRLKLWDLAVGHEVREIAAHSDRVWAVAFCHAGLRALSGGWDGKLKLWDLTTGRQLRSFDGHTEGVLSIAVSRDDRTVLSGSVDQSARLWDMATGRELRRVIGQAGYVWSVALSPNNQTALSGNRDNTIRLWDLRTGSELHRFTGHSGYVYAVAFSPDGRMALSASHDGTLKLWDISEWTHPR